MKQWIWIFVSILSLMSGVGVAACASPLPTQSIPGELILDATIESVGIVSRYTGDDNQNNSAAIWYRPTGADTWLEGPEMVVDRPALEWRVSLVYLAPDTEYEIEVQYTDLDGVTSPIVSGLIRTRPDYPDTGTPGNIFYVPDDGDLSSVIDAAVPGDVVRIREGTYYTTTTLEIDNSGEPGAYLTIEAEPGARVILDGSDANLNNPAVDNWLHYLGNIYYTDLDWGDNDCNGDTLPGYIGEQRNGDGMRYLLYLGQSYWEDFVESPPGSAYYDCAGRLYVVTYDATDPDTLEMHVSQHRYGFVLAGADYVRIRNLEFRYYGAYSVFFTSPGADENIIEGNTFHGVGKQHIRVGYSSEFPSSNNLIQENTFYEHGYRDSGWTWRQGHDYAASIGVRVQNAGPGNVIRRNFFESGTDGVGVLMQSHNTDVYENIIAECMDDGIEVDNEPGYNIRVWGNIIRYCYSGVSNQDWFEGAYWNSGPVYIFRNVIRGGDDPQGRADLDGEVYHTAFAFKVGDDEDYIGRVYYYHNTINIPDSSINGNGIQDAGGIFFSGLVTRNNLWIVTRQIIRLRSQASIQYHDLDCDNLHNPGTTIDDHFIEWSDTGGPDGNGIYRNLADFQAGTSQEFKGMSDNGTRFYPNLSLRAGSPEIDAGCIIVGFNDRGPWAFVGDGPDIGAFEYRPEVPQPWFSFYMPIILDPMVWGAMYHYY